jgi:ATP-binding cassette, subfamily B, bacterial MsbA
MLIHVRLIGQVAVELIVPVLLVRFFLIVIILLRSHALLSCHNRRYIQPALEVARKNKRKDSFWRACRYIGPHRRLFIISIFCAVIVGITFTGGLGTMLPIMQVLISGDTIPDWVNRKIAENRLKVRLDEDLYSVRVIRVLDESAAGQGLAPATTIRLPEQADDREAAAAALAALADPGRSSVRVMLPGERPADLQLGDVPLHLAILQRIAGALPVNPVKAIAAVLAFLLGLSIFGNIVRFFQQYLSEKAAVLAVRDIRHQLYDHSLHLNLSFFGTRGTSDITSRLSADAQSLQDGMKGILGHSIQEPIKAAMALGLALFVSWQLTLFIIIFAPVMMLLIRKFGKKVRRAARAALQNSSLMLGQIESTLGGVRVVKASNAERFERRRFDRIIGDLVREHLRIARLEAFNTPMLEMLTLVVVCCIVIYASWLVLVNGSLAPSTFFLVMACLVGIGESLRRVSKINNILQKCNAAAQRLFEIIDLPAERPRLDRSAWADRPNLILPPVRRVIRFEDVSFTYAGAVAPALSNISLEVEKGTSVAVVGRNGSGKTTLLALLPRFFDPDSGRITIDGIDIRAASLPSLRRQIGIVTQDSVIFPGTIAQNIAYALPNALRQDIESAARKAFAHEFILEKPQGYDTLLGANGVQLSGGQKQRLCIARAILRQTPILILDEATSQVDAESEHLIQQAIESLMHERTTFVIAHRFSTILSADRIIVMDRGRIVGAGSHQELLNMCETYQQLYERQLVAV